MAHPELRSSLDQDGFVKIASALTLDELEQLRSACSDITALARDGKWPYVRTLPKQFPPWGEDVSNGIWGVQHLLHPGQPHNEIFASTYFHDTIVEAVTSILACKQEDLVMELYNLLVCPDRDFSLRWHRDDIGPDVSPKEELQRLEKPILHAQWNLALYNDSSLIVVPGSHRRSRTKEERCADPYQTTISGQQEVKMNAGDVVFYNNNILHRGVYRSDVERMTLHGSMGVTSADPARARNIMQHGIGSWAAKCNFNSLGGERATLAKAMRDRLIEMGNEQAAEYSQHDLM